MRTWWHIVPLGALLLGPGTAGANVFDQFGFEPRGTAMGGAQVASGDNHVASYVNPSLLATQKEVSFGFGFAWAQPRMDVHTLDANEATRLSVVGPPPDYGGLNLGVLFPLGGKVGNRLALGLGLYVPSNNILRTEAIDPDSASWYLYQSSPDRIILAAAAGVRIFDWLYVGGGAQFLGAFIGGFSFRVNLFDQTFERRSLKNDLALRTSPLAGLTVDLTKWTGLRFGFSYRAPIYLDYSMPTDFDIAEVGNIHIEMRGKVHYSPHTFTWGLQYRWGPLVGTAELRLGLWSRAPDPATQVGMTVDSDVLTALGAGERFDSLSPDRPPGFSDTLEPHLGLEWWIIPRFGVRAGYSFRPTMVPRQDGDTNILDGDTHAVAAGIGFSFDDPLEVFTKPVHIDLAYQLLLIPERRAEKSAASTVPSYAYKGHVNQLSAAVRYVF